MCIIIIIIMHRVIVLFEQYHLSHRLLFRCVCVCARARVCVCVCACACRNNVVFIR